MMQTRNFRVEKRHVAFGLRWLERDSQGQKTTMLTLSGRLYSKAGGWS